MRTLRLSSLAAILVALVAAGPAAAQVLHGRVTDAADGSPVAAAYVSALDGTGAAVASTASGGDGRFELPLPAAGAYRLQVSRVGYRTGISPAVSIEAGDRMEVDLSLRANAVELEAVQATGRVTPPFRDQRARRFFERMDRGRGRYISPEQVQEMDAARTSDLLRTIPGVNFSTGLGSAGLRLGGNSRGCTPILYIDGYRFQPYPGWRLDDHVASPDVWAIEVYMYATDIPPDLPRDVGRCGIVMIWRHGS
jgi:Carboxypeptidase regulatory-like domain